MAPSGVRAIALAAAAACVVGSAAAALPAHPLLPGLATAAGPDGSLIGRGFDPVFMKPKGSVMVYTYDNLNGNSNLYTEPESGVTYAMPDQFTVENLPASEQLSNIELFKTYSSYSAYSNQQHSSGFGIPGLFSYKEGDANGYAKAMLSGQTHSLFQAKRTIISYKNQMWPDSVQRYMYNQAAGSPGAQSTSAFMRDFSALPKRLSSTADSIAYKGFVDKYGTHYVESAFFGGQLEMSLAVDSSYLDKHGDSYSEKQAGFSFDLVLVSFGFSKGFSNSASHLDDEFAKSSTLSVRAFGGNPALVNVQSLSQWGASVHLQPAPVNSTFRPIEALITDSSVAGKFVSAAKQYVNSQPTLVNGYCAQPPGQMLPVTKLKPATVSASVEEWAQLARRAQEDEVAQRTGAKERADAVAAAAEHISRATSPSDRVRRRLSQYPILPGVQSGIGAGFDAKTGDTKLPVTELSYNTGKTWYDPLAAKFYSIPDELLFESIPAACIREDTYSLRNATAVMKKSARNSGFNIALTIPIPYTPYAVDLGYSFSKQVADMEAKTGNFSSAIDQLTRSSPTYALSFGTSDITISSIMKRQIDALPSTMGPEYTQLIQYWGTHYVQSADFGGECNFTVTWDQSLLTSKGSHYVSKQTSISIGIELISSGVGVDLGYGFGGATSNSKVDSTFAAASKTTMNCVGGDVNAWRGGDWDAWVQSVRNSPGIIPGSIQLRPIAGLIADATKREVMRQATLDYLGMK